MEVIIKKSRKPDKKFDAVIDGKKTVSFGAKNYSDYTLHKDDERKTRYINRHKKMKIGVIKQLLDFTVGGSSGINQV